MAKKMRFWAYENTRKWLQGYVTAIKQQKHNKHFKVVEEWNENRALQLADDLERVYTTVGGPMRLQAAQCIRWLVQDNQDLSLTVAWLRIDPDARYNKDDEGRG